MKDPKKVSPKRNYNGDFRIPIHQTVGPWDKAAWTADSLKLFNAEQTGQKRAQLRPSVEDGLFAAAQFSESRKTSRGPTGARDTKVKLAKDAPPEVLGSSRSQQDPSPSSMLFEMFAPGDAELVESKELRKMGFGF
ncbi:hypothetical protein AK812_SmicGene804 [Symbiodinium microadriaticum]|uniref:Uncharacterized protein n=1 Tax=Symbiodinium microadriaticum TaxID=2951 RepID=A0A1Q9F5T2_SYMMI|nr:hypothetical protein AK812_SmicGene804 [Symbiodinium microadriaticum]